MAFFLRSQKSGMYIYIAVLGYNYRAEYCLVRVYVILGNNLVYLTKYIYLVRRVSGFNYYFHFTRSA